MSYDFKTIESKWQAKWAKDRAFEAKDDSPKPKQYILDMFPYPSANGLHTGHVESYTATDIISRYLRLRGYNVLHPQGFDAFGLPAENFAIKTKTHPAVTTKEAIKNFRRQMDMMGLSYDWERMVDTSDPAYYKWTQWFFLLLYKNGWAYRGKAMVNWCDSCQTVLANEQAEGGICERCKNPVRQKELAQWFFKITDFIEDKGKTSGLLSGLDKIDWPESTKLGQKNWIGKSTGAEFSLPIKDSDLAIKVFTTRLDTVYGMTFALIAPEHALIEKLKPSITNWPAVSDYAAQAKKRSELERLADVKEKTGVELEGIKAINPFTGQAIRVFVSDFILGHYGTGAVMAVPGHDQRDYDFAKKFELEIKEVIKSADGQSSIDFSAYEEDGLLVNSGEFDGLTSAAAREKMTGKLAATGRGKARINYKMRDWLVSRQRYWGAPIPVIYCRKCRELSNIQYPISNIDGTDYAIIPVPEKDLPVELPTDVDFMPTGESPLKRSKSFQDVKCPICGEPALRESDTMDTFVCSSWYYFRYADPANAQEFAGRNQLDHWLPVDLYVGGAEHTVLHLLYSRFFTKALHNLGYIDFDEPFLKLRHQGIIVAEDSRKMSKSFGNTVNPDDVVKEFGADTLRLYEMFMGPLEDTKQWNTKSIIGIYRFLEKINNLKEKVDITFALNDEAMDRMIHKTIKKVAGDIENMKFNTAISQMMIALNMVMEKKQISSKNYRLLLILLAPFAPHLAEELWAKLENKKSIFAEAWPTYDETLAKDEMIELVLSINGKVRDKIRVSADITEADAKKLAEESESIKKWTAGKEIVKVIFVKGRLLNIVVK